MGNAAPRENPNPGKSYETSDKTLLNPTLILGGGKKTQKSVDNYVDYLVGKYHSPEFIPLFRKAVWHLTYEALAHIVGSSEKATNPRAYFIACVKRHPDYYKSI